MECQALFLDIRIDDILSSMNQLPAAPKAETGRIPSPALLFFKDKIRRNIERAIAAVGSPERLRPHVKSHKCPQIVRMKIDSGITKFKCATLSEARMLAQSGAKDILLAYQPVGPNIGILLDLIKRYPGTSISCIVDHPRILKNLSIASSHRQIEIPVFIDFDVGMKRTGVNSGESAVEMARQIHDAPGVVLKGIHVYDGHHTDPDPAVRQKQAADTVKAVDELCDLLSAENVDVEETVVCGTPMFPHYTGFKRLTLSPGTLVLHDYHTFSNYPDLPYEFAAMILTRVISLPREGSFTVDAGVKAVSVDYPEKAKLISCPEAEPGPMSEEHWRFTFRHGTGPEIGEAMFLIPGHVCTTVHNYDNAYVITDEGEWIDTWTIAARGRI